MIFNLILFSLVLADNNSDACIDYLDYNDARIDTLCSEQCSEDCLEYLNQLVDLHDEDQKALEVCGPTRMETKLYFFGFEMYTREQNFRCGSVVDPISEEEIDTIRELFGLLGESENGAQNAELPSVVNVQSSNGVPSTAFHSSALQNPGVASSSKSQGIISNSYSGFISGTLAATIYALLPFVL